MTLIHNYHPITKIYISSREADLDPIEKKPMLPANASFDEPPSAVEGDIVFFDDGWEIITDVRGVYYNKATMAQEEITDINAVIDGTLTKISPDHIFQNYDEENDLWVDDIDAIKLDAVFQINSRAETERLKYITAGSGQAMVYDKKAQEAEAYIANADISVDDIPHINAEVLLTNKTHAEIADDIIINRNAWIQLSANIEGKRMKAKLDISSANTKSEIDTILTNLNYSV